MRKFYSLVLMATALLIGTNAWADVHSTQLFSEGPSPVTLDEASVKIGGETKYATTLKEAFDYVGEGQTAEIQLLKGVSLTNYGHITMPASIPAVTKAGDVYSGGLKDFAGQNITLYLNEQQITADQHTTIFRIMKGSLEIKGSGTLVKTSLGSTVWTGKAGIVICGAEDKTAADWSILKIGQDVVLDIAPDAVDGNGDPAGTAIIIQDMNTLSNNDLKNSSDVLYSAETKEALRGKFGYCTYYYPNDNVLSQVNVMEDGICGASGSHSDILPMECGAPAKDTRKIQQGSAFGVKVTIAGTIKGGERALQIIGHVNQKPECTEGIDRRDPETYPEAPFFQYKYPYIKIEGTANLSSSKKAGATGIYAAGYGVFDIAGDVSGATGIYMKAGDVELQDNATITSSFVGVPATSGGVASGVAGAGGSAIVIESNDAYAGGSGLNITDNTTITGAGGYGIYEETYKKDETSTTSHISVEGGTIQKGDNGQGAIAITVETADKVVVESGNIGGTVTSGESTVNVADLLPNNSEYHTTIVDGVVTVTKGDFAQEVNSIIGLVGTADAATKTIEWINNVTTEERLVDDLTVKELVINQDYDQTLIIGNHSAGVYKTFSAERIVLGPKAKIIVEPGSTLIVTGPQGVYTANSSNIVLKSYSDVNSDDEKRARFFFNPIVNVNSHPKATVEFISKSFRQSSEYYQWERFGIPTWTTLESFAGSVTNTNIQVFENKQWQDLGLLHKDDEVFANISRMNKPFITYNLLSYKLTKGGVYTLKGELVGNDNATLNTDLIWNPFANSYSADIDVEALLTSLAGKENIDQAVYIAEPQGPGKYAWNVVDLEWVDNQKLAPMAAFIIRNSGEDDEVFAINYKKLVWDPIYNSTNEAPHRNRVNENTAKLRIVVSNEQGASDNVKMTESNSNDHNAVKYMNDDVNIFVQADEKYAIVANDNLEDTYFGFSTAKGGEFTISFTNVEGREFDLIDLETGVKVAVMEGETYSFAAAANTAADYRFKLVERAKMPTAIENTEAVKNVKGIYTITGQYLGEMNVWNTLPAGVYVVNGAKCVK